jgi:hypothetical protein
MRGCQYGNCRESQEKLVAEAPESSPGMSEFGSNTVNFAVEIGSGRGISVYSNLSSPRPKTVMGGEKTFCLQSFS